MKMQVTLNTRISHDLAEWLDRHSKTTGVPKAQIIGKLLEDYKRLVEKEGK